MKKEPLYFETLESEICYDIDYFIRKSTTDTMQLYEAIPVNIGGVSWCRDLSLIIQSGDCGRHCKSYDPKNGKSGMCKFKSNTTYEHGKLVTIKL